ncbi:MAG TPA: Rid family detoxifying hydrolase [Gemmatimonadales bacterium]|nr:Rid family detoxifying hydrolase [Gemmatimonadales bacterium]
MRVPLLFAAVFVTAASAQQPSDTSHLQKRVIQLPGSLPGLPFSSAVRVGNVLYLSGAIGVLPGTRQLVDTGVVKQTQQTLDNIKTVLAYAGSSLDRVFKCTVFLANIRDFDQMNGVYTTYFPKDPPARSTVAGSGLALGAKIEIECLATVG